MYCFTANLKGVSVELLSITTDESRNVIDISQLLLSVRGVNSDFEVSEELACVHMSGATKGGVGVGVGVGGEYCCRI